MIDSVQIVATSSSISHTRFTFSSIHLIKLIGYLESCLLRIIKMTYWYCRSLSVFVCSVREKSFDSSYKCCEKNQWDIWIAISINWMWRKHSSTSNEVAWAAQIQTQEEEKKTVDLTERFCAIDQVSIEEVKAKGILTHLQWPTSSKNGNRTLSLYWTTNHVRA